MSHFYILVRADLTQAQQAVQAAHAAVEAARAFPDSEDHPHLVICTVPNLRCLEIALSRLSERGLQCFPFVEPDLGGELTAFATSPLRGRQRRHLAKYNLMRSKT